LGTLQYLGKETKYVPWRTALNSLGFLNNILSDKRGNGYLQVGLYFCKAGLYFDSVDCRRS